VSGGLGLALAVLLLAGNAFFVGAEFALVSARRSKVEPIAERGSRRARTVLAAMENVALMMAGAQLGVTVCSLGLGAVGEPAVSRLLEPLFTLVGLPDALLGPVAFGVALAIVVALHIVLGEMVPKNIAIAGPERSALLLGPPLARMVTLLRPLVGGLNAAANGVLRLLRIEPVEEVSSTYTADEIADFVAESHREGLLDREEHSLVTGALDFTSRRTGDVVLRPEQLVTVGTGVTPRQLEDTVAETGLSRLPIVDGDRWLGYLHLKDVLDCPDSSLDEPVPPERYRELVTVGVRDDLQSTLRTMQRVQAHLVRVVGEQGDHRGIAALEDVLEELVGEISDAAQRAERRQQPAGA
jgi:CBS domain containing-hemolysin-like protein